MQRDHDRYRPRDGGTVEQSPPSAFGASYREPAPRYAPPQQQPPSFGLPPRVTPHYAHGADGYDAPLIHPAAAQASNVVPYGVPVYRTPVHPHAYVPQPQRGLSITALVLGLCSFVFAWIFVVVPIIGIVFGFLALKREPHAKTLSIIGLVGSGLGLLWVLLLYLLPLLGFLGALVLAANGP